MSEYFSEQKTVVNIFCMADVKSGKVHTVTVSWQKNIWGSVTEFSKDNLIQFNLIQTIPLLMSLYIFLRNNQKSFFLFSFFFV